MNHVPTTLLATITALAQALSDAPDAPTAWVPLRRETVEAAWRALGRIPVAMAILNTLDSYGEVPAYEFPLTGSVRGDSSVSARASNGNGATMTVAPERKNYVEKPTNGWRRIPKPERLALVYAEIVRQAGGRTWLTQLEFDSNRPETMPSASGLVATLGITWINMVTQALPHAVVPAAQPAMHRASATGKEPSAPAGESFRDAIATD